MNKYDKDALKVIAVLGIIIIIIFGSILYNRDANKSESYQDKVYHFMMENRNNSNIYDVIKKAEEEGLR